jgi:tetratricopeptide (TPR) repeat protein
MTDNNQNQDNKSSQRIQNTIIGIIVVTFFFTIYCSYSIISNQTTIQTYIKELSAKSYTIQFNSKEKKTIDTNAVSEILDTRIKDINNTLQIAYTLRLNALENWLAILGLLLTFFGVLVPIFLYIKGKELDKELEKIEKIKKDAEEQLNDIINAKKKIKLEIEEQLKEAKSIVNTELTTLQSKVDTFKKESETTILTFKDEAQKSIQEVQVLKTQAEDFKKQTVASTKEIDNKQKIANLFFEFQNFYNKQEYLPAINKLNEIIDLDKKNADVYNNMGNSYGKLAGITEDEKAKIEYYNKAIENYNKAIKLNHNLSRSYNNRGACYSDLADITDDITAKKFHYKKAIENFNKAIELDEKDALPYNNRGELYIYMAERNKETSKDGANYKQALSDLSTAKNLDDNFGNGEPYNNLGIYYASLYVNTNDNKEANFIEALKHYDEAIALGHAKAQALKTDLEEKHKNDKKAKDKNT